MILTSRALWLTASGWPLWHEDAGDGKCQLDNTLAASAEPGKTTTTTHARLRVFPPARRGTLPFSRG